MRYPVEVHPLSAGVKGGIVGGVAMALVALVYGVMFQRSLWYPINLLSAVAMPQLAQADLATLRAFKQSSVLLVLLGVSDSAIQIRELAADDLRGEREWRATSPATRVVLAMTQR